MFNPKRLCLSIFLLCIVHRSLSKPYSDNIAEGRGLGSTIWGWITYPFSWWSSDDYIQSKNDQFLPSDGINLYDIEISRHNVTVWCNDQTCTTMRCDKYGCSNVTCNIYDTDITGECRIYNVKPDESTTHKYTNTVSKPQEDKDVTTKAPIVSTTTITSTTSNNPIAIEDRPLELEAVLSSTVTEKEDKAAKETIADKQ